MTGSVFEHIKHAWKTLGVVYVLIILMLIAVEFLVTESLGLSMSLLSRDPAATFHSSPFIGVISNIGIIVWSAAVAICLFCSGIFHKQNKGEHATFFRYSGLITFILLIDDLFMFHDLVFPKILHFPEKLVYAAYFLLIVIYLFKFYKYILKTEYAILGLALILFGLSMLIDQILPSRGIEFLIEDGMKLLGITTWYIYFERTGSAIIMNKNGN